MSDSAAVASPETAKEPKRHSLLVDLGIRLVKEKPLGTVGAIIVLVLLFVGIFADLAWLGLPEVGLAPYGYNDISLDHRLAAPSAERVLGADNLGRDLLSRVIYGARISLTVGLGASVITACVATIIGALTGFLGGKLDMIVQRFVDSWMCLPPLFLILTVMSILGPGLVQVIVVLGVQGGITGSRVVRSAVMDIRDNVYVQAARAIGASTTSVLRQHILPNIMPPVIILFTITMGAAIIAEASISFLGFGIPPPIPSWGGMLSGRGREFMLQAPWMALWPGLALAIVVYGVNMFGDALRDLLDPRLRGGVGRYTIKVKDKKRRGKEERQKASPVS